MGSPSCPGCVCTYPPWCHPCRRQDSALAMANCPGRSTLAHILRFHSWSGTLGSYHGHLELSETQACDHMCHSALSFFSDDQMQPRGRWPLNHLVCPAQYHDGYWYSHNVPSPSTYLKLMGFKGPNKGWKQETVWKRICQMLHQNLIKCYLNQMRIPFNYELIYAVYADPNTSDC